MAMFKENFKVFISIITASLIFFGCDDTLTPDDVDNRIIPQSDVSYSLHIAPILELKCVSCHNPSRPDGGVELSTWIGVTNPNILTKGSAETSIIVWTVERRSGFPPMPPLQYLPLTTEQIRGLRTWIDEGAENN
jgi:hypothetical protein